jgi:hypothetical protein
VDETVGQIHRRPLEYTALQRRQIIGGQHLVSD